MVNYNSLFIYLSWIIIHRLWFASITSVIQNSEEEIHIFLNIYLFIFLFIYLFIAKICIYCMDKISVMYIYGYNIRVQESGNFYSCINLPFPAPLNSLYIWWKWEDGLLCDQAWESSVALSFCIVPLLLILIFLSGGAREQSCP